MGGDRFSVRAVGARCGSGVCLGLGSEAVLLNK